MESQQSSSNNASKQQLKVSCGVSSLLLFMTDQSLSPLVPFGTASDKEFESALICLTSCLMVSEVDILGADKVTQVEW
jgi:hypothetical protein